MERILDIHAHIYPPKIAAKAVESIGEFYHLHMSGGGTVEHLIETEGKVGITDFLVQSVATKPAQVSSINDFIHAQVQSHPELTGFATLHPAMEDPAAEIERVIALGLKGIKLHPDFQVFAIDDPCAIEIYRLVAGRLPILMHMGDKRTDYSHPRRLANALDQVENLTVIAAHFGGYSVWDASREYLIGRPGLYIDTSSSLFKLTPEEAGEMIHHHGTDRVLFGTDYPMWDAGEELERFARLPLSDEERRAILFDNGAKLLGLV